MKGPLVSVLMVNYNHEDSIRESIESVLSQSFDNLQFVIVDDGSTDRSCEIIESFHDPRIEFYRLPENRHICYATNFGLEKVRGNYLARIDSDDLWLPDKLERQLAFLSEHPEYKICFTQVDLIDEHGCGINESQLDLLALFRRGTFTGQVDALRFFFYEGNCLAHPSVLMDIEVFRKLGDFNPCYMQAHDFDYWVRAAKHYPLFVMQEPLTIVRKYCGEDCLNTSNTGEINTCRFLNEFTDIRAHFFDDMSDALFLETFRSELRCPDASTPEELACEKAFLLCTPLPGTNVPAPAGFNALLSLFQNKTTRETLETRYHFIEKDFYRLSGQHIFNDSILHHQQGVQNAELARLRQAHDEAVSECTKADRLYRDAASALAGMTRRCQEKEAMWESATSQFRRAELALEVSKAANERLEEEHQCVSAQLTQTQHDLWLANQAREDIHRHWAATWEELQHIDHVREEVYQHWVATWDELQHVDRVRQEVYQNWVSTYEDLLAAQEALQTAQQQLQVMQSSRFWKLTKPLRFLTECIRRLLHGNAGNPGVCGAPAAEAPSGTVAIPDRDPADTAVPANAAPLTVDRSDGAEAVSQALSADTETCDTPEWPPKTDALYRPEGSACIDPTNCRRLMIFVFYDRDGIVDDYIPYLLQSFLPEIDRLVIVSNGALPDAAMETFRSFTQEIIERENAGLDAWANKTALEYVGWDSLADYDEVILMNATIMGPVLPLRDMFLTMDPRDVEFWGLAAHPGMDFDPFHCNPYGIVPEHLQSFFLVFRKPLLRCEAFRTFWRELPVFKKYDQAVGLWETVLTKYFSDLGFRWDSYLDREAYYPITDNLLVVEPVRAIRDYGCPFFKRRAFFQNYDYQLAVSGTQGASLLLDYLKNETSYPTDWVWDTLLRGYHMSDLAMDLHLVRVLDSSTAREAAVRSRLKEHPTALFMHLYDPSMAEQLAAYAASMPPEADIYISTTSEEKQAQILRAFSGLENRISVRVCPNRGRDVSGLLAGFKDVVPDYEYICVTHDKKTAYLKPETVGEGFAYLGYENILTSRAFVCNVLQTLMEESHLGLLCAPGPNHADFCTHLGLEWGPNYAATRDLAETLHLHVPMDERHPPCAPFGSNFWARTSALKPLFDKDWTYEDFPPEPFDAKDGSLLHAIERIYPFCAQHAGYYSAELMSDRYSAIELGNLEYYTFQYTKACESAGIGGTYLDICNQAEHRLQAQEAAAEAAG